MHRQMPVILVVILAVLAPATRPAQAQFALSPRGILGAMTRPLRGLLGRLHHRGVHHARRSEAHDASAAPEHDQARRTGPSAARYDAGNPYEALLGYTFWPVRYDNDFNRYGFGAIAVAIAGPSMGAASTVGSAGHARLATTGGPLASPRGDLLPQCDIAATSTSDWLTGEIRRSLRPDAKQLRAYDKVRGRLIEGSKAINASCTAAASDSPTQRLAALKQRLWALHDAGQLVRPALKDFYDTLSDQQKAKFTATTAGEQAPPENSKVASAPMGQRYQACAAQSAGATERLIADIEKQVRPAREQQAGLQDLREKSAQMEKLLLASCAQPTPKDPMARLDAADERLVAMNFAASNLEMALNNFYASLDKGQKTRFESLGH
jgi:LTXXQ motif family protein